MGENEVVLRPSPIMDPRSGISKRKFTTAPRIAGLKGARLAMVDIGKRNGDILLEELSGLLKELEVAEFLRERKPLYEAPMPDEQFEAVRSKKPDAAILAIAE